MPQSVDRVVSSCRGGEDQFLLPDTPTPRHRDLGSCLDVDGCSLAVERIIGATGITTKYTYQPNTNYVQTETVTNAAGTTLASYTYTYRADGLKTGETDTTYNSDGTVNDTRTLAWTYDGLDRLTQETSTDTAGVAALNYIDAYSYDLDSNRTTETVESTTGTVTDTITSTYNANDELTQAVDANTGTTVYGYDPNGSQTSVTHTPNGTTTPDTTTTNEYDLQGQLAGSQVTNSSGTATTTYFYDDSGNRIEEVTVAAGSTTPMTTYYLVDTNNPTGCSQPIEQAATPGTPQITYIWGAQLISETYATGATIPGVGTASSPTTYYLFQDAHGSTRLITDATGNVVARYNYDAFGNALGFNAATALTTYLYSSMPFDAASGNYYDHARFYDSGTGSFTQADYGYNGSLANPMSDLPYAFTGGDPINMLDLNGHDFGLASFEVSFSIQAQLSSIDVSVGATAQLALQGFMQGQTSSEIITEFFIGQLFGAGLVASPAFLDSISGAIGGFFRAEAESGTVAGAPLDSLMSLFSSVDITDQMSADAANSRFMAQKVANGENLAELVAPYRGDTLVAEARTTQPLRLVRFYNPAAKAAQTGGFMTILDQVRGLTPQQIQDVLSLQYSPTMVTDVNVPVGTNIAIGTTSAVFGDAGGGLQVELLGRIPDESFTNPRDVSQLLSGW